MADTKSTEKEFLQKTQFAYNNNANCTHLMYTPKQKTGFLDSIKLSTTNFDIDIHENFNSQNRLKMGCSPTYLTKRDEEKKILMWDTANHEPLVCDYIRAEKTIRGTGILEVKRLPDSGRANLTLQCSIPKFLGKENIYLADDADFQLFKTELQKELDSSGIYLNVDECKVTRLDVTKNVETEYSFAQYIPLLRKLQFSRDKLNREYNNQTYLMGNKSKVLCCYNKIAEMESKGENIAGLPDDIFRAEYRALKTVAVKSLYGFQTVGDVSSGFADIESIYKKALKRDFFKNNVIEKVDTSDVLFIMEKEMRSRKKGQRNWFEIGFLKWGLNDMARCLDSININEILMLYRSVLEDEGKEAAEIRNLISRQRAYINKTLAMYMQFMKSDIETVSLQDLYNELYKKLVA